MSFGAEEEQLGLGEDLCWCGLSKEEHDGRELDLNNNLHRFGEQVNPPSPTHYYEDEERGSLKPIENKESLLLLSDIRTFLEHFIVVPAQNGSKKFPLAVVNNATELVRRINKGEI